MEPNALRELGRVLPDWSRRLDTICVPPKFPEQTGPVAPVDPNPPEKPKNLLAPMKPVSIGTASKGEEKAEKEKEEPPAQMTAEAKKAAIKNSLNKARFSSLTGPDIVYDGEIQKCFFDCWTLLNAHRGSLRKEMMLAKRKRIMALPMAGMDYDDDSDETDDDSLDADDETEEQRAAREEKERKEKEEEKRRQEEEKKRFDILEYIDGKLDIAGKSCEACAFLFLKGDGCPGHIVYIQDRVTEALRKIEEVEGPLQSKDEGFEEEGFEEEEDELPHKLPPAAARLARMRAMGLPT